MAAEVLAASDPHLHVELYDAMPSVGRKFLLAGIGGLNLTHSEPVKPFLSRYGERERDIAPMLATFGADHVRNWALALGVQTFVGSSGRVFPHDMKAAPLLRAWLHRLRGSGVKFFMRHRWQGWAPDGSLQFLTPAGQVNAAADVLVLALGGASWSRLGSDGAWVSVLAERGVAVAPLLPANCGFDVAGWTPHFSSRFAGQPLKSVAISFADSTGRSFARKGEFVATATGVEGSLIYAASSLLRGEIAEKGIATFTIDLLPDKTSEQVLSAVAHPRGSRSLSSHLKSRLNIDGIKAALLYELLSKEALHNPVLLAEAIKALPVTLTAARPIDEAISSAGGVSFAGLTASLGLVPPADAPMPVFCAGEMLDWEAPTGGYLLTACFASGVAAAKGALQTLQSSQNLNVL